MEIHSIETEAPLTEAGTHSIVMKTRQAEAEAHSTEAETHSTEAETHSTEAETHSTEAEAHSTEAEATMAEETEMAAVLFDRLEDHASHK